MSAKAEYERFKPVVRAELEKQLARYPRSLKGVRRLQLRDPGRYMRWHILQLQLQSLDQMTP